VLDALADRRHRGPQVPDKLEFRRRLAEHERRFLRPTRADLNELAAAVGYRGADPGPTLWTRAIAAGRIPQTWADDPSRRFRATAAELAKLADVHAQPCKDAGGRAQHLLPTPPTARAALLFASDPTGLAEAERLGREIAARLEAWGAPKVERVAWRLAGNPIDRVDASGPPLGVLGPVIAGLQAALDGSAKIYEPPHRHRRFQIVIDALQWSRRRKLLLGSTLPAVVRRPTGELTLPAAVVGRTLGELPDPLEPWLELALIGYALWAITDAPGGAVLELAAPFPPPRRLALDPPPRALARQPKPSPDSFRMARPRAVWSQRLTGLRLACARGDPGAVRHELPLLAADDEPHQPKLIHFAVYGGPEVLAVLAEHHHGALEARDPEGRTALMLAAALPRQGPAGASSAEIDVPISDIVGAASCEWLIAAGADTGARDHLGRTALHWAAPNRRLHAVAVLVEAGASLDALDQLGRTPLMRAIAAAAPSELIEILLAGGADPDVRDAHGWTALHYLASGHAAGPSASEGGQRALARRLHKHGARPSRDRAGRSPADLCLLQGIEHRDGGPLDPRTGVASGDGPKQVDYEASLARELIAELVPDPDHTRERKPDLSPTWMVWADWLQSRGDPRGELVATSFARAAVGSRRGRELSDALVQVEQRCAAATWAALYYADPFAPVRPSPIEVERTHGFVTKARLSGALWQRRSGLSGSARIASALIEAARSLLAHAPLLAELRVGVDDPESWAIVLAGLRSLAPAPHLRRLVFERLPATLPDLIDLDPVFPGLRSLWLLGAGKLNRGRVHWPGPVHLRLRHGDTSEWTQGSVDLDLRLPDLTHLDLALPIGMRTVAAEIEGCAATLARLESVRHLKLQPLAPEFATAIFNGPTLERLRTLELERVRGQTIGVLARFAGRLRGLERVRIQVTPTVADQRDRELEALRAELPGLLIG